ncbi:hypothetical protein BJ878DRAFT_458910 [Calycina marina]|uniref:mRNA 3'-end-processing protein n=1 Tax=Calycina marina TaxID=1763456 RepID=A0A9P7Z4I2_9HELO|nr:hypothetical protein BJ878DRAFT_458910 [Calycina marina]
MADIQTATSNTYPPGASPSDLAQQILTHNAPPYKFSFTPFLLRTHRHGISPSRPVCKAFMQGHCPLGAICPDKHPASSQQHQNLVCKHWLRGLCKKGEGCEFLHEYNLRSMPDCASWVRNGYCTNGDECLYLHAPAETRIAACPHYMRGFCPLGLQCAKKHVRRRLCPLYLCGFCPDGMQCRNVHAKYVSDERLGRPMVKVEKTEEEKGEETRIIREKQEQEEERDRERWLAQGGAEGGRGRGGWRGRGQRGQQRSQRGRGHY